MSQFCWPMCSVLAPKPGDSYLDLTVELQWGTLLPIAGMTRGEVTLVDRDQNAVDELKSLHYMGHSAFFGCLQNRIKRNRQFDLILADLGVSSPHLNNAERVLAYQRMVRWICAWTQSEPTTSGCKYLVIEAQRSGDFAHLAKSQRQ